MDKPAPTGQKVTLMRRKEDPIGTRTVLLHYTNHQGLVFLGIGNLQGPLLPPVLHSPATSYKQFLQVTQDHSFQCLIGGILRVV